MSATTYETNHKATRQRKLLNLLYAGWPWLLVVSLVLGGSVGCASGSAARQRPDGSTGDEDGNVYLKEAGTEAGTDPGVCGDGVLDSGEVCDDGNTLDGDDCRSDCGQDLTLCGNGTMDPGEACDDGNTSDGDGCSSVCQSGSCTPTDCPDGCCSATNACLPGTLDTTCGSGGAICQDCTITGQVCEGQTCVNSGSCTPGTTEESTTPCGTLCGHEVRTCNSNGEWGPWGCMEEGDCTPGEVDDSGGSCGSECGYLARTCSSSCQWGGWECIDDGECSPGAIDDSGGSCGNLCGHERRTCDANCEWGGWQCVDEGECSPGSVETGISCGTYHENQRTCDSNCDYGGWDCVCTVNGHQGTGEHDDPCSQPEAWRCVSSNNFGTNISQVCRDGAWITCELNPPNCGGCCGDWSSACGDCV